MPLAFRILILFALWIPVELGWVKSWVAPLGAALLVFLFRDFEWRWRLGKKDLRRALGGLAFLTVTLLPVAHLLHFIRWSPGLIPAKLWLFIPVFALVEEILFRGVMQQLFERWLRNRWAALLVTAVIFGLSHVNNRTAYASLPNWKYVILATIAGLGYGAVWMRTRNVLASTLTHSAVNILWKSLFV